MGEQIPVDEAARRLGVLRASVYRLIREGKLTRFKQTLRRRTLVDADEVGALLESRREER